MLSARPVRLSAGRSMGTHEGEGRYGAPSGADIHIMGISQCEFGPDGLLREWVLIDDTAVWKQVLLHTG